MTLYLTVQEGMGQNGSSHTILRQLLHRHAGCSDFRFGTAPGGKPYAISDRLTTPLYFSLSHSGAYLALLVHDRPVGVDLQAHMARHTERLAKRWFHPAEYAAMAGDFSDVDRFFRLWAAKEAYGKYLGCGFSKIARCVSVLSVPETLCILPCLPKYALCVCAAVEAPVTIVADPSVSGYMAAEPIPIRDAILKR